MQRQVSEHKETEQEPNADKIPRKEEDAGNLESSSKRRFCLPGSSIFNQSSSTRAWSRLWTRSARACRFKSRGHTILERTKGLKTIHWTRIKDGRCRRGRAETKKTRIGCEEQLQSSASAGLGVDALAALPRAIFVPSPPHWPRPRFICSILLFTAIITTISEDSILAKMTNLDLDGA